MQQLLEKPPAKIVESAGRRGVHIQKERIVTPEEEALLRRPPRSKEQFDIDFKTKPSDQPFRKTDEEVDQLREFRAAIEIEVQNAIDTQAEAALLRKILRQKNEDDEFEKSEAYREYIRAMAVAQGLPPAVADRMANHPRPPFLIRRLASQGAMGTVFESASLSENGRREILKFNAFDTPDTGGSKRFQRFYKEALIASTIDNEHVVKMRAGDFMPDESGAWFTMEKIEGEDMHSVLSREAVMSPAAVVDLLMQVADGLQSVHGAGIAHRDLKAANIMRSIDDNGYAKYTIIDFGLAKNLPTDVEQKEAWVKGILLDILQQKKTFSDLANDPRTKSFAHELEYVFDQMNDDQWENMLKENNWLRAAGDNDQKRVVQQLQSIIRALPSRTSLVESGRYEAFIQKAESEKVAAIQAAVTRLASRLRRLSQARGAIAKGSSVAVPVFSSEKPSFADNDLPVWIDMSDVTQDQLIHIAQKMALISADNEAAMARLQNDVEKQAGKVKIKLDLSEAGLTVGTPVYMSPEQVRGQESNVASDIFALGVLAYRALSGELPFTGNSFGEIAQQILRYPPKPLVKTGAQPKLVRLIESLLHKDPSYRPTAAAVFMQLQSIQREYRLPRTLLKPQKNIAETRAVSTSIGEETAVSAPK